MMRHKNVCMVFNNLPTSACSIIFLHVMVEPIAAVFAVTDTICVLKLLIVEKISAWSAVTALARKIAQLLSKQGSNSHLVLLLDFGHQILM